MPVTDAAALVSATNADPEFLLAARYWNASLALRAPDRAWRVEIANGRVTGCRESTDAATVTITAPADGWREFLAPVPRPFYQDLLGGCVQHHGFTVAGDMLVVNAYYHAIQRLFGIMREVEARHGSAGARPSGGVLGAISGPPARMDTAVGRYVYLAIDGIEYRVYFEETGQGIPLLLQHTAGADARQWRHLLEDAGIQTHFRMIAYDLPYHAKSVPPAGVEWWKQEYRLTRDFFMKVPVTLAKTLELDRPVFMGCSIGGHLAADLACDYPGVFRAAISLEGALASPAKRDLSYLHHPHVSNEFKAALMFGITSPTSPEAYRRETGWVYSQGAPAVFKGDLHYYTVEHDLTARAGEIDTKRTALYVLTGEYDWSSTPAMGQGLASAVPGATFRVMPGLGHFPMSEDPARFRSYILPVLDEIRTRR
jgi:pimeloyl-ACP methyl ester carboxylesterase